MLSKFPVHLYQYKRTKYTYNYTLDKPIFTLETNLTRKLFYITYRL